MNKKSKDLKVSKEESNLDLLGNIANFLSSTVIIIKNDFPQLLSNTPEFLAEVLSNIYFLNFVLFAWHGYKAYNATGNRRTNEAEKAFLQLAMGIIGILAFTGLTGGWGVVAIAVIAIFAACYCYLSNNKNYSFTNNVLRSQCDHTENSRQAGSKIVPAMQQF